MLPFFPCLSRAGDAQYKHLGVDGCLTLQVIRWLYWKNHFLTPASVKERAEAVLDG
ncbi:hypothetical protein ART_0493 [Arthrobacter sp. PAMC 25486]|nr:hypothetical protein ART_0493 [Arthrobacter sp. PAMC 25486]